MRNEKKIFRSRIGVLLTGLILVPFIPMCISLFLNKAYQGFYILGGVLLFGILIITGMRCVISGEKLYLKMWFISNRGVNISDIVLVKRSYNPIASHAASFKRLSIHFKTGGIFWLISPVREKEFIEALKAINPNIYVHIPEKTGKWWRFWDWDI